MAKLDCSSPPFFVFITTSLLLLFYFMSRLNQETIENTTFVFFSSFGHQDYTNHTFSSKFLFDGSSPFSSTSMPRNENTTSASPVKRNMTSELGRTEADLAIARRAIHEAIRRRNYTVDNNNDNEFIPRGCVYKHAYAFHQSHLEMLKRFKIWVYKEGERPLFHNGPMKDIYSFEGQFMDELENGSSPFVAKSPNEAHVFFLPVSIAHIIKYIYTPLTTYSRDSLMNTVKDYAMLVGNKYPYWNRSSGADHFMLSCHDWAPDVTIYEPVLFKNLMRVLCNANTSEGFNPVKDAAIPEIRGPANRLNMVSYGQKPDKRTIMAFFAGGAHGYIRQVLLQQWKDKDSEVQVHEYLDRKQNYLKLMGKSKFCLCPSGYEVASPRIVEAILSGCVPVIISDHYHLPFSDVLNWNKFTLQIPVDKIAEIKTILSGISNDKYIKLYKRVLKVQRHFEVNRPAKPYDVIHMTLHSIWLRRLNIRIKF